MLNVLSYLCILAYYIFQVRKGFKESKTPLKNWNNAKLLFVSMQGEKGDTGLIGQPVSIRLRLVF